jgi:DNA-binding LacI/PurR family transcriptional regulator
MPINFQKATPLYIQIIDDIKEKITQNNLAVGEQLKSHKELAEEYEVSLITIKNALSSLIDEGYLYSRVGKGTFVAQREDNGQIKYHDSIGLVLHDLKNPFFSLIAHVIEDTAYSKSYNMLLSSCSNKEKKAENQIKRFKEVGVKGMIVATLQKELNPLPVIRDLHDQGFPFVMVSYVADKDIWYVGTNHELGASIATQHLIDLGHTEIGYINSPQNNSLGNIRLEGYRKTLTKAGLPFKASYLLELVDGESSNGYNSGYKLGDAFHHLSQKPTAYFVYNDLAALGFIKRVQELGYRVPEDIAIVGFDDIEQAGYSEVPLTTIHQPIEKIGATAIEKLIQLIEGKKPPVRTTFEPHLVVRDSCGANKI